MSARARASATSGFLDPLYSSGVLLALRSGEQAADAIGGDLAEGDTSAAQLGKGGLALNEGVDRIRRLVCEYYDRFSFGKVVKSFPELRGKVTDLLIGDPSSPTRWTRSGTASPWTRPSTSKTS